MMRNILSIDVEEVFHGEYTRHLREQNMVFRTPFNIPPILRLLKERDVKATFFIVGEVVEKFPEIINMIAEEGHEIAFHSYDHKPLSEKNREQLEAEIERFNVLLTSKIGERCMGFRAPSYSLDNKTKWTLEVLEKLGMLYDSSIFPTWTPLYGVPGAPLKPYKPSKDDLTLEDSAGKVWEFPLAVYSLFGLRIPAAGGFYLRLIPNFVRRALKQINEMGTPATIYIHNWELDPETPKLNLNLYGSFVTYHNIEKTKELFKKLLNDFQFTSFKDYMQATGID